MYLIAGSDEGSNMEVIHVETGESYHTIKTSGPCPVVAWHPNRYHVAYTDMSGLKIIQPDTPSSSR
jgi:THO complex subunit 3